MNLLTLFTLCICVLTGCSMGYGSGQIKANAEPLRFLRESSARADALHLELVTWHAWKAKEAALSNDEDDDGATS